MEVKARRINDILLNLEGLWVAADTGLWHGTDQVVNGEILGLASRGSEVAYAKHGVVGSHAEGSPQLEIPLSHLLKGISEGPSSTLVRAVSGFYIWDLEDRMQIDYVAASGATVDIQQYQSHILLLKETSLALFSSGGAFLDEITLGQRPVKLNRGEFPAVIHEDGSLSLIQLDPLSCGPAFPHEGYVNATVELPEINSVLLFGSRGPLLDGAWLFDRDLEEFLDAPWSCDSANEIHAAAVDYPYVIYADKDFIYTANISNGEILERILIATPGNLLPLETEGTWKSQVIGLGGVSRWVDAQMSLVGEASGAQLELRSRAYGDPYWQPWQETELWIEQRPGDEVQARITLKSFDGVKRVEVQGIDLRYEDAEGKPRELHIPLWDFQLIAQGTVTSLQEPVPGVEESSYVKPGETNLSFALRASRQSYPVTLHADLHLLDSASLPDEIAQTRAVFYANSATISGELNLFNKIMEATLDAPASRVGVSLNRFPYSSATERMAQKLAPWMRVSHDPESEGQKWLNVLALEFEEIGEQLQVFERSLYLETATEEPAQVGIVILPEDFVLEADAPWRIVEDLPSFYYNLGTPVAYHDPSTGILYVSLKHLPFTSKGQELPVKSLNLYNALDNFGDLLGLKRLPEESNRKYFERLQDVFKNPANASLSGLVNGISRELGIPKAWVAVERMSSESFLRQLFTEEGLPTERMRQYVKAINSQAMVRWGYFRWDEAFWLDDNSEAYLPNVFDPKVTTHKIR